VDVFNRLCGHCVQETDDSEPQLEDATEPAQAAPQPADMLPERDVPVAMIHFSL